MYKCIRLGYFILQYKMYFMQRLNLKKLLSLACQGKSNEKGNPVRFYDDAL